MFERMDFNGPNAHEVSKFLRINTHFLQTDSGILTVPWNFAKWILDSEGKVVSFHQPPENPMSFEREIQRMLAWSPLLIEIISCDAVFGNQSAEHGGLDAMTSRTDSDYNN